jgi:hypothetical protein
MDEGNGGGAFLGLLAKPFSKRMARDSLGSATKSLGACLTEDTTIRFNM